MLDAAVALGGDETVLALDELVEATARPMEVADPDLLAGEAEGVVGVRRDGGRLARLEPLPLAVDHHFERAFEHLVALDLGRVTMGRGREGVGGKRPLHLDELAVGLLVRSDDQILPEPIRHHVSIAGLRHAANIHVASRRAVGCRAGAAWRSPRVPASHRDPDTSGLGAVLSPAAPTRSSRCLAAFRALGVLLHLIEHPHAPALARIGEHRLIGGPVESRVDPVDEVGQPGHPAKLRTPSQRGGRAAVGRNWPVGAEPNSANPLTDDRPEE